MFPPEGQYISARNPEHARMRVRLDGTLMGPVSEAFRKNDGMGWVTVWVLEDRNGKPSLAYREVPPGEPGGDPALIGRHLKYGHHLTIRYAHKLERRYGKIDFEERAPGEPGALGPM